MDDGIPHYVFFKQKTAYEILSGLVGSEMCIRVSFRVDHKLAVRLVNVAPIILCMIVPVSYIHLTLPTKA